MLLKWKCCCICLETILTSFRVTILHVVVCVGIQKVNWRKFEMVQTVLWFIITEWSRIWIKSNVIKLAYGNTTFLPLTSQVRFRYFIRLFKHYSPLWNLACRKNPSAFLPCGHCTLITYSYYLQIPFNLISPWSSSFPHSLCCGSYYYFLALFCYLPFQYIHTILIWAILSYFVSLLICSCSLGFVDTQFFLKFSSEILWLSIMLQPNKKCCLKPSPFCVYKPTGCTKFLWLDFIFH